MTYTELAKLVAPHLAALRDEPPIPTGVAKYHAMAAGNALILFAALQQEDTKVVSWELNEGRHCNQETAFMLWNCSRFAARWTLPMALGNDSLWNELADITPSE